MLQSKTMVILSSFFILSAAIIYQTTANSAPPVFPNRFYVVPTRTLDFIPPAQRPKPIDTINGLSLISLNADQVQQVAYVVHKYHGGCGGFVDVQVHMEKYGMNARSAFQWVVTRPSQRLTFDLENPRYPEKVKEALARLSIQRYTESLRELSSFPDRYSRGPNGAKTTAFLAERAKAIAQRLNRTDIVVGTVKTGDSYTQDSVVVRIPGRSSNLPGVVVGGHMDTLQSEKPGADDDGTGSMTVQETYTAILASGLHFDRDIYFIFYAAEEMGLVGSQRVVQEFLTRKIPVRGALQFDMTGFKSPRDAQEIYLITDHVDLKMTAFLKNLIDAYLKVPVSTTKCGYACSDHASWTSGGISSAFPFESAFENYNHAIHSSRDKMDILNMEHAFRFVQLGTAFVVEAAEPTAR